MKFRVAPFLVALLLCSPAHLLPRAEASVAPTGLDALKALFAKDPATAFEKSWKLPQEPRKPGGRPAGDWDGKDGERPGCGEDAIVLQPQLGSPRVF